MPQTRITRNLWFDTEAEEAAEYDCSIFENSRIVNLMHYPESSDRAGTVVVVEFELDGTRFVGINGGSQEFKFNEAVSFQITCETQEEIDSYWDKLIGDGGEEGPCGWLKDRYGLSWQVTPTGMDELFSDPDRDKANRAWKAMMEMRKLDIAELQRAAEGAAA